MSASSLKTNQDSYINWTGKIFNKKYILIKKLGYGSYACVWLAYNSTTKQFYAIKIHNSSDTKAAEKEYNVLKKVNSLNSNLFINVIESFSIHNDNKNPQKCIVLELMACSLFDLIKNGKYTNGLPIDFIRKIIKQIVLALINLHKNKWIHTDVKPENILLTGHSLKNKNLIDEITNKFDTILLEQTNALLKDKPKKSKIQLHQLAIYNTTNSIIKTSTTDNTDEESYSDISCGPTINTKPTKTSYRFNKELIYSKDNDNESNSDYSDSSDTELIIDESFLNTCSAKLSDMGTCIKTTTKQLPSIIQTRNFRAPEVILKIPYNEKCDIWSIGCMLYELLTGDILFDSEPTKLITRDRTHLYTIQMTLGTIPHNIINQSPQKDIFFKNDGTIKGPNKIKFTPLWDRLESKIYYNPNTNNGLDKKIFCTVLDFIQNCLDLDHNKRPSAEDCLKHEFLH